MIEIQRREQFTEASERARKERMFVQPLRFREYVVANRSNGHARCMSRALAFNFSPMKESAQYWLSPGEGFPANRSLSRVVVGSGQQVHALCPPDRRLTDAPQGK
jgi:hypothetical protein